MAQKAICMRQVLYFQFCHIAKVVIILTIFHIGDLKTKHKNSAASFFIFGNLRELSVAFWWFLNFLFCQKPPKFRHLEFFSSIWKKFRIIKFSYISIRVECFSLEHSIPFVIFSNLQKFSIPKFISKKNVEFSILEF